MGDICEDKATLHAASVLRGRLAELIPERWHVVDRRLADILADIGEGDRLAVERIWSLVTSERDHPHLVEWMVNCVAEHRRIEGARRLASLPLEGTSPLL